MEYEITVRNYHPKHSGLDEYYTKTFEANNQREAERQALKEFRANMPFTIEGELIEIHSVNGIVKEAG
jgi:hypothetical protein